MKLRFIITALVALLIFCAGFAALFIAPDEATMHAIQRIFYFHVASWNAMFCAFFIAFYASVAYLVTGKRKWDALGVSGVEVGVICCTGVSWGKLEFRLVCRFTCPAPGPKVEITASSARGSAPICKV